MIDLKTKTKKYDSQFQELHDRDDDHLRRHRPGPFAKRGYLKNSQPSGKGSDNHFADGKGTSLNKWPINPIDDVLTDRFRSVERLGTDAASLETVNRKAAQKLEPILSDKQFALYEELRERKKQEKEKNLKEHPGFAFSDKDIEMDF